MSDESDRDLLAAEYVLGVLEGEDRSEAVRLLAEDPEFARAVAAWQQRLTPLASEVAPVVPPEDLWRRIEARVEPSADIVPFRRRVRFWQATTAAALAIAASLAAFVVLHKPERPQVAVLSPLSGGAAPVLMAVAEQNGTLVVRPTAQLAVPADKDLELWQLPEGATRPQSLGVLPASGETLEVSLALNTQLLVSLEPKGGSPTGQPTGPVLYGGLLTTTELPRG
jgi:anti-sigma-K factor RskA